MSNRKYDWVKDDDVRWHLAAEAVIILFNERTMKQLDFSKFAEYRKVDWNFFPDLYDDLIAHEKCLNTAISEAHKRRFGCKMTMGTGEEIEALHDLILRVYCHFKENAEEGDLIIK